MLSRTSPRRPLLQLFNAFVLVVLAVLVALVVLAGCGVASVQKSPKVPLHARWVVLPLANHSEAPRAAERVQAIVETQLRQRGANLEAYAAPDPGDDVLFESEDAKVARAVAWAKEQGFAYGVTGAVLEWRYKGGADGEPAVAIRLRLLDLAHDRVLWESAVSKTGWGRESTAGTAMKITDELLAALVVEP